MARRCKSTNELLIPAAAGWQRWSGADGNLCEQAATFDEKGGAFGKDATQRVLALPASMVWVVPAWLKGEAAHLHDMAVLHLERMAVRTAAGPQSLEAVRVAERDGAHLTSIQALKDMPAPLANLQRLPEAVVLHAQCYPLPADCLVIYRELGRLVVVITHGNSILYCSPLSSMRLDQNALSELNHICLQLGFQGVLGRIEGIVLWLEDEGDLHQIRRITGLPAQRAAMPAPLMPQRAVTGFMPADLLAERGRQQLRARTRLAAMGVGLAAAAAIAVMGLLISLAAHERETLRSRIADLSPRAAQVEDHQRSWNEAAPAVDPSTFPMQILLNCMEPGVSHDVSLTHFEATPQRILLRGRTTSPAPALQYAKEITETESLMAFNWETPAPEIAADNSATFELKGARGP